MKQILIIISIFFAVIIGYTLFQGNSNEKIAMVQAPFNYSIQIRDAGLLDYNNKSIAFITAENTLQSVENLTLDVVLLPKESKENIFRLSDYYYSENKGALIRETESKLKNFQLYISPSRYDEIRTKNNSIIILVSDALPSALSNGSLKKLINNNVIIYFGKPLDIGLDVSGSQVFLDDNIYKELDVTYSGFFSSQLDGPKIFTIGNATIFEYPNGWLVLYPDEIVTSNELADMIIYEKWQSEGSINRFYPTNGSKTFYTDPIPSKDYILRLIYDATSKNNSSKGKYQFTIFNNENNKLSIESKNQKFFYTYELESKDEYPTNYKFELYFIKDGKVFEKTLIKPITMKDFARESEYITPNISSGSYVVNLVDHTGTIHASSYLKIPELKIKLVRISSNVHTFQITRDGKPVPSSPITLNVNDKEKFNVYTNEFGEAETTFILSSGIHNFTVHLDGEKAVTYYKKSDDDFAFFFYPVIIIASLFIIGFIAIRSKNRKKWYVKTHVRPQILSKTVKIPFKTFIDLYKKIQDNRSKGQPISVPDLRIGLRKYATFFGAPLFVTDSNLYLLIDELSKDGSLLVHDGFFIPKEMTDKPIEYLVLKRKISDFFIENGKELTNSKDADFLVDNKLVHIYETDPKNLASLCKKTDNIMVFPNSEKKENFLRKLNCYDKDWIRLSLEYQYGRLFCETLDEFLERGLNVKK